MNASFKDSENKRVTAGGDGHKNGRAGALACFAMMATVLSVALAAPALSFAVQEPAARGEEAASGAPAGMPGDISPVPETGVTQVPARGRTQLPATPVTPRPHDGRPPAHLP